MRTACVLSAITLLSFSVLSRLDGWATLDAAPTRVVESLSITSPTAIIEHARTERSLASVMLTMLCIDLDAPFSRAGEGLLVSYSRDPGAGMLTLTAAPEALLASSPALDY